MSIHDIPLLAFLFLFVLVIVAMSVGTGLLTMRLRMKHGYPIDGRWGQPIYPRRDDETVERVKLLTQENAKLRAELGSIKDRLATVERIVTDRALRLDQEIESLRGPAN